MNRTITISTDVFAAIWAQRQDGEDGENSILRRVLGCATLQDTKQEEPEAQASGGFHDNRNNVSFPRGFEIFRTYKRKEYRAVAQDGTWLRMDTGDLYASLNQLNASITVGNESVWNGNWKYRTDDGTSQPISALRL